MRNGFDPRQCRKRGHAGVASVMTFVVIMTVIPLWLNVPQKYAERFERIQPPPILRPDRLQLFTGKNNSRLC